jgi:hypothetical protein
MSYASSVNRALIIGCALLLLGLAGAPDARAAGGLGCDGQALERPFLPWLDPAHYVLVPDGDFSGGAAGWRLSGADVVDDNEPWYVHGDGAPAALRLRSGDSATSAPMCVSVLHPTIRFFARGSGSLKVEVVRDDGTAVPIGAILGLLHGGWAPSLPLPVVANLIDDEVAFRFTAVGHGSSWGIDDVYVDPYRKG